MQINLNLNKKVLNVLLTIVLLAGIGYNTYHTYKVEKALEQKNVTIVRTIQSQNNLFNGIFAALVEIDSVTTIKYLKPVPPAQSTQPAQPATPKK